MVMKHENLHVHIDFLACALSGYIFVNPFTSCVTDCYQHKQCIVMETKHKKHENLHVLRFYWLCATCYIFVNPFTSCVTDRYTINSTSPYYDFVANYVVIL